MPPTARASVLYKIASPKFPKYLRTYLFKYATVLENITVEEAKDICQRFNAEEIGLDSPEIKALNKYRRENNKYFAYAAALDEAVTLLEIGHNCYEAGCGNYAANLPGERPDSADGKTGSKG